MNAIVPLSNAEVYRASTDAAGLCGEIVKNTALTIQGKKYVRAEGWLAIATAHGCIASADNVQRVEDEGMGGFRAHGTLRRISDGMVLATAEGFVGDDEPMWKGRPVYARRAMAQTRAVSRVCRSAFAHVVVLIDKGLSTTPAEEVPDGGFGDSARNITPADEAAPAPSNGRREPFQHINPEPEGEDWWGAEGPGPAANYAKKTLGLDGLHDKFCGEIHTIGSLNGLIEWCESVGDDVRKMPRAWRIELRNRAEERRRELKTGKPLDAEFKAVMA